MALSSGPLHSGMGRKACTHAGAEGMGVELGAMVGEGTLVGDATSVGELTAVGEGEGEGDGAGDGLGATVAVLRGDGGGTAVGVLAASARAGSPSAARPSAPDPRLRCRKKSRRSITSGSREESGCRYRRRTSLTGTRRAREKSPEGNSRRRTFVLVDRMNCDPRVGLGDRTAGTLVTSTNVASLVSQRA